MGPTLDAVGYAYEHTAQGSGLRKSLADTHSSGAGIGWERRPEFRALMRKHPHSAADWTSVLRDLRGGTFFSILGRCGRGV